MGPVLITGGSGFIGRHLRESLGGKFPLLCPSHEELDLMDSEAVKRFVGRHGIRVIIHAASRGVNRNDFGLNGIFRDNLQIFLSIASCEPLVDKIIFFGSGAEYGKSQNITLARESDFGRRVPEDEYGLSKYAVSQIIKGMDKAVNLRCFGVYGVYEDFQTRFISYAIVRAILKLPIILKQDAFFEYIYVKDLCKIVEIFMVHEAKEKFYNAGPGRPVSLLDLARLVLQVTGEDSEILIKKAGRGNDYTANTEKIRSELRKFSFTEPQDAIAEMASWYRKNLSALDLGTIGPGQLA